MSRLLCTVFLLAVLSSRDCWALDVLVNQVGFEPNSPKLFRVQRASDYAGGGTFSVKRVSDGVQVFSGTLTRKGALWDKFYWEGDFSSLKTPGDCYISATVSSESGSSYDFAIQENVWLDQTGGSFVLTDGSDTEGIKVITEGAPGVAENEFVKVEGAAGWENGRVVYRK